MPRLETRVLKTVHLRPTEFILMIVHPDYDFVSRVLPPRQPGGKPVRTLLEPGIETLAPDDLAQTLTVQGPLDAIREVEALLRLLDVKPKEVQVTFEVGGSQRLVTQVANNGKVTVLILVENQRYEANLTLHINRDGAISFWMGLASNDLAVINWGNIRESSAIDKEGTITAFRKVPSGEKLRFTWNGVPVALSGRLLP